MERGRIEYDKLRLSALETLLSALAGGAVGGAVHGRRTVPASEAAD